MPATVRVWFDDIPPAGGDQPDGGPDPSTHPISHTLCRHHTVVLRCDSPHLAASTSAAIRLHRDPPVLASGEQPDPGITTVCAVAAWIGGRSGTFDEEVI
mmetsp:Transcript_47909/g.111765  ORF Transcript_47909/g.111765 Transcript_47909/m.111765 type:complete len:100 (+) Transcript_47909:1018-1317(+)